MATFEMKLLARGLVYSSMLDPPQFWGLTLLPMLSTWGREGVLFQIRSGLLLPAWEKRGAVCRKKQWHSCSYRWLQLSQTSNCVPLKCLITWLRQICYPKSVQCMKRLHSWFWVNVVVKWFACNLVGHEYYIHHRYMCRSTFNPCQPNQLPEGYSL